MSETLPRAFGPYLLLARLGQGGAGTAYLARPLDDAAGIPTPVVVKSLHEKLQDNDEYVRRFRHEAELAVRVDSNLVARVFDVGAINGTLYIALEYVPGWTLGRVLAAAVNAKRPVPLPIVRALTTGTLRGLSALHTATDKKGRALDIVHRDISPKNVMVGDDGEVRLIDLGLGKSNAQDWKTAAGRVMGSPGYMAKEQLIGEAVDRRADLYAVGVMLHELLTGDRYLKPDSSLNMLRASLEKTFVAPSQVRPEVSPALDKVVERAMAKEADDRYPTAEAFIRALAGVVPEASAQAVAAFVDGLLGSDKRARLQEVERLLGLALSEDDEPEVQRTEIFVRREGVSDLGDPTRFVRRLARPIQVGAPTVVAAPAPPPSESTRLLAQPLAAEPRSVTPPSTSSSQRVIIQPKPNRRVAIMVTLAVAMGTGLVLGLVIGGSSPDALPTRPVPVSVPVVTPEVAERAPEPAIAAHPEASTPEPSVSPGEDSNPRRPDRPERIDRRPRVPRPASDDPPPPERALGVDPKEVIQLSQKLQQEALAKKSAAAPESALAMACDKFLARVAMARAARDPEQALSQLQALAKELKTLE
ncbi:MAG: serine/threonine protein kinase [Deltaproteobacteria bacterium]|nr:serine/threonine protein kinase [Deltaproteobacteria bacterium]